MALSPINDGDSGLVARNKINTAFAAVDAIVPASADLIGSDGTDLTAIAVGNGLDLTAGTLIATGGGGLTNPLTEQLQSTYVVASVIGAAIANAGTGGTPGTATVIGTTGTGTKFQADVTIEAGGTIESVDSISVAGAYTVPPTDPTAEPVTGGDLVGATLNLGLLFAPGVIGSDSATGFGFGFYGEPILVFGNTVNVSATLTPLDGSANSSLQVLSNSGPSVIIAQPGQGHAAGAITKLYAFGEGGAAYYSMKNARGVAGAPLALLSQDPVGGGVEFLGFNGTNYVYGATIYAIAEESFSAGHSATSLHIVTYDLVGETWTERVVIDGDGNTNILNGVLAVATARAIAALPASPVAGMFATVNDALTPTIGLPVASGGAASAVVCYGGTQWTVVSI